jgi:hypothetical protein
MSLEQFQPTPLAQPTLIKAEISSVAGALEFPHDQKGELKKTQRFGDDAMPFIGKGGRLQPYNPTLSKDGGVYKITFYQGYVIERLIKESGEQVLYHSPSNMNTEFSAAGGDCFYVEFSTDKKGNVTGDPIIVKKPNGSSEDRFYPEVGEYDGQTGKFLYKLCSIESNNGVLTVKRFHAGDNIHHVIERVTMLNLPVVPPESTPPENVWNVLKNYSPENDEVRYRSLKQLDVLGEPLINPLQTGETKETRETIDFRRIAERETGLAQIKVKGREAGIIHIEGNNKSGRLVKTTTTPSESGSGTPTVTEQVLLEWDDGLVTTEGDVFFEGGDGGAGCVDAGTGTLETIEEGASTGTPLLTWENGCVKTNGTIQLEVVELEVCIDGVPTLKKFLTLPEPPPPAP